MNNVLFSSSMKLAFLESDLSVSERSIFNRKVQKLRFTSQTSHWFIVFCGHIARLTYVHGDYFFLIYFFSTVFYFVSALLSNPLYLSCYILHI